MDKMNKVLYIVLLIIPFFTGGILKLLSGRTVPGIVHLVLYLLGGIGWIIAIVEAIVVGIKVPADSEGNIAIPKGFFDFLE